MKALFHKRVIVCLLAVLLMLQIAPLSVRGEVSFVSGDWENIHFELDCTTGELVITGEGEMPWVGPYFENLYGIPWFDYRDYIKSIRIEDGVTLARLRSFEHCSNITHFYIGKDVQNLKGLALIYTKVLESIEVSPENPYLCVEDGVLFNEDKTVLIRVPVMRQGEYVIPDTVTEIAGNAFYNCEHLTNVTIPYGVTTIWNYSFWGCKSLTSLYIPDSVTKLDASTFAHCESVTELYISEGLTEISSYAFDGMKSLKHVVLPKNLYKIKAGGFRNCTSLESVVIFNKLRSVHLPFDGCDNLKNIYYIGTNEELWKFNIRPDHLFGLYDLRFGIDGTLPNGIKWDLESNQRILTITGSGALDGNEDIWEEYGEFFDCVYVSGNVSGIENCIDSSFKAYGTETVNGANYKVYSKTYTITFDANGGTGAPAPQTKRPGKDLTLPTEKPKREGYAFLGWAEKKSANKPDYTAGGKFEKNADKTLYAVWGEVYATDLKLATPPAKTVYKQGEELSLDGAVIELYDNTDTIWHLPYNELSVSGYDSEKEGKQTVTLDYYGMKVYFEVTVLPADLTVKKVSAKVSKTEYTVGDAFDPGSVELTVTYSDGTTQQVTEGFAVEGFDASKAGVCKVTLSYEGVSTSVEIVVSEKETETTPGANESTPPETDASEVPGVQESTSATQPGEENEPAQNTPKRDFTAVYIAAAVILLAVVILVIVKKKR